MTTFLKPEGFLNCRWGIRRDMPEVLAIEQASFSEAQRWQEDEYLEHLRQRNTICMVVDYIYPPVPCTACEDGFSRTHKYAGERTQCLECHGTKMVTHIPIVGFMVYELFKDRLRLINMAVDHRWRGKKVAQAMVNKLRSKLSPEGRQKIVALVPETLLEARKFCSHCDIEVILTDKKGVATFKPRFATMTLKDVAEVQVIEAKVLLAHDQLPRSIKAMLEGSAHSGIVGRDERTGNVVGYALYSREAKGIHVNGEFGIIVDPEARGHGIGRKLALELKKLGQPIIFEKVNLFCKDQRRFLKAIGVPVPQPERFVTLEWK